MDGLTFLGFLLLCALIALIVYAKKQQASEDRTGERIAMQNRDWLFPERQDV
jgi:hypothetical protein